MTRFTLVIGNKNYSSWSLRAWLAMRRTGAEFEEIVIPLDRPDSAPKISAWSEAGMVPILRHTDLTVWDSLAIGEYLAELYPDADLWPEASDARALARSAVAEMHSGFAALRRAMPMDIARRREKAPDAAVATDIARICALWSQCRTRFGQGHGDFLFGPFTLADAFFAPVVTRFVSYEVELPDSAKHYRDAIMAWPDMQAWCADAAAEPWVIENP